MSTAALNRKYFDAISDSYDNKPWWGVVNQQVSNSLRSQLDWVDIPFVNTGSGSDAKEVRLLDYACGTGFMTRTFGPYVTKTMGIDVSPNMVSTYNTRAREAGIPETTVNAVVGDLFDKSNPAPAEFSGAEWQGFDLATVGFGFHHFEDVGFAAQQLKERLRPGGVLVITDFVEGGDFEADENGALIPETEGYRAVHKHGHGHGHEHGHGHGHGHEHGNDHTNGHAHSHDHAHEHAHSHQHKHEHKHDDHQHSNHHHASSDDNKKHDVSDTSPEFRKKMTDSIVIPSFTLDGVREFFTKAGFVDIDVFGSKEKSYMELGGVKLYRTVLYAKARRPFEEKSEL